jgi:predicted membrane protein
MAMSANLATLLSRYRLDKTGALTGDDLLDQLASASFRVRRYANNAALDDELGAHGLGRVPTMPLIRAFADQQADYACALVALKAPDQTLK